MDVNKMDHYYEQLVKKFVPPEKKMMWVFALVVVNIAMVSSIILCGMYSVMIFFALGFLAAAIGIIYIMIKNKGIEYEYTFVSGEMRIERIKNGLKRKKITSFDIKAIDDIDKFIDYETGKRKVDVAKHDLVLRAEQDWNDPISTYYVIIHDKVRHKPAILIFAPDEITLSKLRPYLSIELKKKFMKIMADEKEFERNHPRPGKKKSDSDGDQDEE